MEGLDHALIDGWEPYLAEAHELNVAFSQYSFTSNQGPYAPNVEPEW